MKKITESVFIYACVTMLLNLAFCAMTGRTSAQEIGQFTLIGWQGFFIGAAWIVICMSHSTNRYGDHCFGPIKIAMHAWPWHETSEYKQWRVMCDNLAAMGHTTFPTPPQRRLGWRRSGANFDRVYGIQVTWRDVRLDLGVGIVWISWAEFDAKHRGLVS